jgi:hypothetical protein
MELRYGHLCDYAGLGAAGKIIVVGIYDTLFSNDPTEVVGFPLSYLVFKLECSIAEGHEHTISVRLKDDDEETLPDGEGKPMEWGTGIHGFVLSGPGRPLIRIVLLPIHGLAIPGHGDYAFEVIVDEKKIGSVPFFVAPNSAT